MLGVMVVVRVMMGMPLLLLNCHSRLLRPAVLRRKQAIAPSRRYFRSACRYIFLMAAPKLVFIIIIIIISIIGVVCRHLAFFQAVDSFWSCCGSVLPITCCHVAISHPPHYNQNAI